MRMRLALALLAAAIIAAGCGGGTDDADDAGGPPDAAPTTEADAPAPTADADDAPAAPAEPESEPAAPDDIEPHPSDAYFALDRVMDVSIEIDVADWDTLRHQTRTLEDVFAEIQEHNLSRPFADIYTWFSATVTVDGETYAEVGVRKKGFVGSQSDTKPSLKLRFDKYVDGQSLGGVMERMTLNNSLQDPSFVNTCLSYRVFTAAGNPASRCNFATVAVNGTNLGLYVHVEEIKAPFLLRHFDRADGNLYEGNVSDFTPVYRGTFEKKNNTDADDWSDIDAVVAALADPSSAGLETLGEIVDLDRYLTHWATEVLVGHWDGYAGDRNNYWFYREPGGHFVFIPWGVDDTFHLRDDPNPFDNVSNPPVSVLALTAIPNRLYNHPGWRAAYVERLKEILERAWDTDDLLAAVDEMAAVVQRHALPAERKAAKADTERVRKFILKREGEILADLTPEPPEWPEPDVAVPDSAGSGALEVIFSTTWGSSVGADFPGDGTIHSLVLNGSEEPVTNTGVFAGDASPDEQILLPDVEGPASIVVVSIDDDSSVSGMSLVVDPGLLVPGAALVIGADAISGGVWSIPPGEAAPDSFSPFVEGTLELTTAGTTRGDAIAGTFSGQFGRDLASGAADSAPALADAGLVINEVAARGDPLDWFELHNSSSEAVALDSFVVADNLADAGKRVAFPAGTTIEPGAYMQFSTDKDGWPGFALGGDEELGIWLADGTPVDRVDWEEGDSPGDQSFARMPDATGDFRTVATPTPGAPNQP